MEPTIVQAAALIRERMAEIDEERKRLEESLRALTSDGAAPTRRRGTRTRESGGGRRKTAPRGQRRKQLLAYLEKHPGARPSEIAKAIRTSPSNVHNMIRRAREEKLVKKQGRGYGLTSSAQAGSELAVKTNR